MADVIDPARVRALGRGLACSSIGAGDIGRDLRFEDGAQGRRLAMVEALENLKQCLEIGLTTALGSDSFNVDFGFDGLNALAEGSSGVLMREQVRVAVIRLLQKDARVRRIIDLKLLDGRLDPVSTASTGRSPALDRVLAVNVAFEAVTGDQTTLNLGRILNA